MRLHSYSAWLRRIAVLLLVSTVLAACYELDEPVIGLDTAVAVDDLLGEWNTTDGQRFIYAGDVWNEYRFRDVGQEMIRTGTLRAVNLGSSLYLFQAVDDEGAIYALYYRRTARGWARLDPVESAVDALAARFGVTYVEGVVSGPKANVRAFLLAHGPQHLTAK